MVDLSGHEAGNGGYSQRKPTAHRDSSTRKRVPLRAVSTTREKGLRTAAPPEHSLAGCESSSSAQNRMPTENSQPAIQREAGDANDTTSLQELTFD
jgi:hypothetical protein